MIFNICLKRGVRAPLCSPDCYNDYDDYFELSLTVMKDEAHGVHSMLLCKTGKYSVMLTVMELT